MEQNAIKARRHHHLRSQSHQQQALQSQILGKCDWALVKAREPLQSPKDSIKPILTTLDHLDLVPGGRTQVGDENVGPWLGASTHRAPLLLSSFPWIKNEYLFLFYEKLTAPPLLHNEVDRGTVSVLPSVQMDTQAVLGRLHKLVWVRHRGFSAWLCRI